MVRALGLEPSLVRGKSPVPYQSGVTRMVGREGIEPPVSDDGWSTAPHGATDPCGTDVTTGPSAMPLQLSKYWCPDWRPGASKQARKESNPRPSGLEAVAPPWLEPKWKGAHDVMRVLCGKR